MPNATRQECFRCAYPLDSQGSVLNILSHVQDMLRHVGYIVDRFVIDNGRNEHAMSVSFDLRRSQKRLRTSALLSEDRPSKRTAACRHCVSSCCSTNSLCKANACGHRNEEISKPLPSTPPPDPIPEPKSLVHTQTHLHNPPPVITTVTPAPPQPPSQPSPPPPSQQPHHRRHHHHPPPPKQRHHHHHRPRAANQPPPPNLVHDPHSRHLFSLHNENIVPDPTPADVLQGASFAQQDRQITHNSLHQEDTGPTAVAVAAAAAAAAAAVVDIRVPKQTLKDVERDNNAWTATTAPPGGFDASRERVLGVVQFPVTNPMSTSVHRNQLHAVKSSQQNDIRTFTQQTAKTSKPIEANELCTPRPPPDDLACTSCPVKFPSELELRKHQFIQHKCDAIITKTAEGRFLCLLHSCPQSFVRRHVMERHFKTVHMLVKDFPCSSCDRAFADSSTRDAHRSAVHEKKKPWVCNHCSSTFTQSSSLGKHRRRFHLDTSQSTQTKR